MALHRAEDQYVQVHPAPLFKREWCGADLFGTLKRDEFGLDYAPQWAFKPDVTLRIQGEALADKE